MTNVDKTSAYFVWSLFFHFVFSCRCPKLATMLFDKYYSKIFLTETIKFLICSENPRSYMKASVNVANILTNVCSTEPEKQ